MTDTSNLPESARVLVEHLGARIALKLMQAYPGLSFRVPMGLRDTAPMLARLIELLGEADAQVLIDQFGGETIYVATCKQAVRDLRDQGIIDEFTAKTATASATSVIDELALSAGLTARQISNILKRTPGERSPRQRASIVDERQIDMF